MFVYLCRPRVPGQRPRVSNETVDVGWYARLEVAALDVDPGHVRRIDDAFERWNGEIPEAIFDPITSKDG